MRRVDLVFSGLMVLLSVYIFIYSLGLGSEASLFPKLVSIPFFFFSLLLFILTFNNKKLEAILEIEIPKVLRFIYSIIAMILYSLIIEYLGFYISSVLLFVAITLILSNDLSKWKTFKSKLFLLAIALITVAVIYVIFNLFLNVPLPTLFEE